MTISIVRTWCTLDEAETKYGVPRNQILGWAEEGVVRVEEEEGKVVRVNVDDIELKVGEMTGL